MQSMLCHNLNHLWSEVLNDFFRHFLQVEFWIPTPIFPRNFILQIVRPTISNILPHLLNFILHLEPRNILLDLGCQFLRTKRYPIDVIARPHSKALLRSFHQLKSAINSIISIHHRQIAIFLEIALELLTNDSFMENINCIVCCSSSGGRSVSD